MILKLILSSVLLFVPITAFDETLKYTETDVVTSSDSGNSESIGGDRVYPRVDFPGRDISRIYLGKGSIYSFSGSYLAGLSQSAPAIIKNVRVDNPTVVDIPESEFSLTIRGKQFGETTVTVDVYHKFHDDIWTTATIPVTVTSSVYGN